MSPGDVATHGLDWVALLEVIQTGADDSVSPVLSIVCVLV